MKNRAMNLKRFTLAIAGAADCIVVGISLLNLLFVVGPALWGNLLPVFGVSLIYRFVLALPVLSTALTVAAGVYTVLAWRDGFWRLAGRVHYTLVTVAQSLLCGS